MSQLSQLSESGFSDIIPDVDTFIEENGMTEHVGQLMQEIPSKNKHFLNSNEVSQNNRTERHCG
ncbi:hypothetical protein BDFB_003053 [Asbolus verrucosus]|uniref:Uncharacterized protein n=1 Tax=Asbolus verrucosus TaxID=1661398 RepID=A0A482VIP1_ASBVE|nr:hypothetical protein BDFB_003053 [Asbolus verrucosus]